MKNKKQILKMLNDWGKNQQDFWINKDNIKLSVMKKIECQPVKKTAIKRPIRLMKFGLALGMSVVALFLVTNWLISPLQNASVSDNSYNIEPRNLKSGQISVSDLGIEYSSSVQLGSGGENVVSKISNSVNEIFYGQSTITPPAIDNREYLKYYYQANLKTRQVEEIASRVQTIIRGYGGRVDNNSINEKHAYVSFVVPKKSFDQFKTEIEYLVSKKFISVSTNGQNLLSQKITIEENTKTASSSLNNYQNQKDNLTNSHNKTIADYTSSLNYYSGRVWNLQQQLKNTTSTSLQADLKNQINSANYQWSYFKKLIDDENKDYAVKLGTINNNIYNTQGQLVGLKKQDTDLNNNVETVEGTITIQWVSCWQILEIYIPFYRSVIIGLIFILILYLFYNRRRSFKEV